MVATGAPAGSAARTVWRLRSAAVCCLLTALAFAQDPGLITADTKVDLAVNPSGWLARALHMWNPVGNFGEVQNQAYGYLWPMGPFFALGSGLGMPAWVVQRLWWALLLCVAYTGVVVLAGRLRIGTPTARIVAGVAFALSPRILTELGTISVEAWPTAIAPWVLVPLIGLTRGVNARRSVALSALAVACAGGVNATAVFAVVPLAVLWLATARPIRRRPLVIAGWCAAVACATAWWVVPLLLLGRYSPPFLDYIETAAVTTNPTDLTSVLRGTSHWLAYLGGPYGPTMSAGHHLIHDPALFAATIAVAALGVAGLARKGLPHRSFLLGGLVLGVSVVTLGHLSSLDTLLSGPARAFLDGAGAPLRNLHKFDVLLRLPLALGLTHLLGLFGRSAQVAGRGWHPASRRAVAATVAALAAIAGVATPALAGTLAAPGSFVAVPGHWREAAAWLNAHTGRDHALVIPAARFPRYIWGSPSDEITQPLVETNWGVRSSIPLTPAATIRLLNAIDDVLASGAGSRGLAEVLARSDVRYLVLRSDLNYGATETARPLQVRQALSRSPGIAKVAAFGPEIGGGPIAGDYYDHGFGVPVQAVEIFEVGRATSPAGLYDADAVATVVGGPESLLDLAQAGQLTAAPTVLAGDLGTRTAPGPVVITDGLRRREVAFGRGQDAASATYAAGDQWQIEGSAHDYLPSWGQDWTTAAAYDGISSITASSSWAQPQPLAGSRPEHLPFAAVDGDPATSWRTAPGVPADGQWLEIVLAAPARVEQLTLTFDAQADNAPTKVLVRVGPEEVEAGVVAGKATVKVPGSLTTRLRVTILETTPTLRVGQGGVGIAEVEIPGVSIARTLVVPPATGVGRPATVVLSAAGTVASCFFAGGQTRCNPAVARGSEDAGRIDRTLTLPAASSYTPTIWARPKPGAELDAIIDTAYAESAPLGIAPTVTSSSRGIADPTARPGAVIDGDPSTAWYAGHGDGNAWLRLRWPKQRTITGLRFALHPDVAATRPEAVTVVGAGSDGVRGGTLDGDGNVVFDRPLRTTEIVIFLLDQIPARSLDPYTNAWQILPMAVGEVTTLPDPGSSAVDLGRSVDLPCGSGPDVQVAGERLRTALTATLRDLLELREVPARVCAPAGAAPIALGVGKARVVATSSPVAEPTKLALTPAGATTTPVREHAADITTWTATDRRIAVSASDRERVLVVRENVNPGWIATVGGKRLTSITLDGWQQGWLVPPEAAGEIVLSFAPDGAYRAAILTGAGLVVVLILLALLPGRSRPVTPATSTVPQRAWRRWLAPSICGLGLIAIGGVWAVLMVGVAALIVLGYHWYARGWPVAVRHTADRAVARLLPWLPPTLVCLAGVASWQSAQRAQDALPQALALAALVVLATALRPRPMPAAARLVDGGQQRPLDEVVAGGGEDQPDAEHQRERAEQVAGEDCPAAARAVDEGDDQRVPEEQTV